MTVADRSDEPNAPGDVSPAYESRHDWVTESPTTAVVRAVASVSNCKAHELPSLHASIDPDALNALLMHDADESAELKLSFAFAGWRVRVGSDGSVAVLDR